MPHYYSDAEVRWCPWPKPKATWADDGLSSARPCRSLSKVPRREQAQIVARVKAGEDRESVMRAHQISRRTLERLLGVSAVPEARGEVGRAWHRCRCGRRRDRRAATCRLCAAKRRRRQTRYELGAA